MDTSSMVQWVAPLCTLAGVVATLWITNAQARGREKREHDREVDARERAKAKEKSAVDAETAELFFSKSAQVGSNFTLNGPMLTEEIFTNELGNFSLQVRRHVALGGSGHLRVQVLKIVDEFQNLERHAEWNWMSEIDQIFEMLELAADLAAEAARSEGDGDAQKRYEAFEHRCGCIAKEIAREREAASHEGQEGGAAE